MLGKAVADSANTGNKDLDKAIGNLAANLAAGAESIEYGENIFLEIIIE